LNPPLDLWGTGDVDLRRECTGFAGRVEFRASTLLAGAIYDKASAANRTHRWL